MLAGESPIVIIGANGSGKTRQSRGIASPHQIEFVNALRNTRVAPDLPAMGVDAARQNFTNQKAQSHGAPWELASEFDYMLSQLLAQYSAAAIDFQKRVEADVSVASAGPMVTPLKRIEALWAAVFPGRQLEWRDWKPMVRSTTSGGGEVEYTGNQMSDGEKAALFLAGRVFSFDGGVLVVDEPETHFHSLLAVRFWNELEDARPDIRFIYVTHDLTFALSRRDPVFVLASPMGGLKSIDVGGDVPEDVAEALLGSASLSFYASRVVFCEGTESSWDSALYEAWFKGQDTVVRPVGSCQSVMRCVGALRESGIANALTAIGIIDRDYHPQAFIDSTPPGVHVLGVHEVESLLSLPSVVEAVCAHLTREFETDVYTRTIRESIDDGQARTIAVQRWKAKIEPNLAGLVSSVSNRSDSVETMIADMPRVFDMGNWGFDPVTLLRAEVETVDAARRGGAVDLLPIVPGKQLLPLAARAAGMEIRAYVDLITGSLRGPSSPLNEALVDALGVFLPPRFAELIGVPSALETPGLDQRTEIAWVAL